MTSYNNMLSLFVNYRPTRFLLVRYLPDPPVWQTDGQTDGQTDWRTDGR